MASLGHLNAVGKVFGFKVSGLLGWLMWRAVYLSKLPGLERKLKVFIEWTLELLFPRDISLQTDSVMLALKVFKEAAASMLPVINQDRLCKGWLRLDFVFDLLHQGKARADSLVGDLLILPSISVKPDDLADQALLRFAQTPDREFAVENDDGQLIGILALLDLVLTER
jgi:CBS-domain-containing membrane protein